MKLTKNITLPPSAVSHTIAILAQKGAGKTYTGKKMAEGMLEAGAQIVALDPTGVWWGLKADGAGKGFPILVMGGSHGDIPLPHTSGATVADFVIDSLQSVVLDLSGFESNGQQDRFVTDFAERLFRAKVNTPHPLHLMIDEADSFAPQRCMPGQQRMLGAIEAIVRRGRSRGLGMTMISQRPAVLNKNVLTQADLLIALRVVGVQDHKALGEWTAINGTKANQSAFLNALASLPTGEAFFWSPSWLDKFERGKVLPLRTYDSSSTPVPGTTMKPPKITPIDIPSLSAKLMATVESAKENDPKALRAEVLKLRGENETLRGTTPAGYTIEDLNKARQDGFDECRQRTLGFQKGIANDIREWAAGLILKIEGATLGNGQVMSVTEMLPRPLRADKKPASKTPAKVPGWQSVSPAEFEQLAKCDRAILGVLHNLKSASKSRVAMLAGYSAGGGGFQNALSRLRGLGYITGAGELSITDSGAAISSHLPGLPSGKELHDYWLSKTKGSCDRKILEYLIGAYPDSRTKDDIATATGYAASGGGFQNALSRLRTMELIEGRSDISASPSLF